MTITSVWGRIILCLLAVGLIFVLKVLHTAWKDGY